MKIKYNENLPDICIKWQMLVFRGLGPINFNINYLRQIATFGMFITENWGVWCILTLEYFIYFGEDKKRFCFSAYSMFFFSKSWMSVFFIILDYTGYFLKHFIPKSEFWKLKSLFHAHFNFHLAGGVNKL